MRKELESSDERNATDTQDQRGGHPEGLNTPPHPKRNGALQPLRVAYWPRSTLSESLAVSRRRPSSSRMAIASSRW